MPPGRRPAPPLRVSGAVQIAQMAGRVQQLLSVVLAVDVQQLTPQLPQLGHGHQPPVHPADIPAVPWISRWRSSSSPPGPRFHSSQPSPGHAGEHRVDQGRLRPGADQLPGWSAPQHPLMASMTMDLPAPVSPVRALKPGSNWISARSMTAIFSM